MTTTTKIAPAGFIAIDSSDSAAIWGVGITAEKAITDALKQADMAAVTLSDLWTLPATAELIDAVNQGGGMVDWYETESGIAVAR